MKRKRTPQINEPEKRTPVARACDVVVCGGGPAGVAAALAAARNGAKTLLIELQGCLGGVWTSGMLSWIIDHENKTGIMTEILETLENEEGRARRPDGTPTSGYSTELMKLVLERLCLDAGVEVRLHSRVVGGFFAENDRTLTHVLLESPSGREAVEAKVFIDATGNGDLAARSGCGFDLGHPESGLTQPMSLMALLCGLDGTDMQPYLSGNGLKDPEPKMRIKADLEKAGISPSYSRPTLFGLPDGLYAFMANHQYGGNATDADSLSAHTLEARQEIHQMVTGLRNLGGVWKNLTLVATAAHIGIREGRRIHGRYTVSAEDLKHGARFDDAVCRVTFCVDIHSLRKSDGGGYGGADFTSQPYDIPYRALVAKDVDGLLLAGRCISGDFFAHASYRVTGNAVAMGEAAGKAAARCVSAGCPPHELDGRFLNPLPN
ncbi:MAG: FAD-dependent oxidoreductase [Verrucomicrobia bacterium]|nr:FAD-dependent oxidoreductase [Verrucomicrobiota bacterium]MCH8526639.1 FAD-dependent oxidoreductase [Kiritimatiellia bacterium]